MGQGPSQKGKTGHESLFYRMLQGIGDRGENFSPFSATMFILPWGGVKDMLPRQVSRGIRAVEVKEHPFRDWET